MGKRSLTSLLIVVIVALAFVLKALVPYGEYFFDALILAVTCIAVWEMAKLLKGAQKPCYKYLAVAFPVVLFINHLFCFIFDANYGLGWTIIIDVCLTVLVGAGAFLFGMATTRTLQKEIRVKELKITPMRLALDKAVNTTLAFVYPALLLTLATLLNHISNLTSTFAGVTGEGLKYISIFALILLFVIPASTDTFSYLVGTLIGGKKLCPNLSPKKTIAGAVGGFVFCVLLSMSAYLILNAIPVFETAFAAANIALWHVAIVSVLGSVIAQCGDLFESFLKRRADVKDSGKILPGHGGMLDRLDSYIFVSPYLLVVFCIILLCL